MTEKGCPETVLKPGTPGFCPCWEGPGADDGVAFIETNIHTGEERVVTGCFFRLMPRHMKLVIAASNRPAASIDAMRVEMVESAGAVIERTLLKMVQIVDDDSQNGNNRLPG